MTAHSGSLRDLVGTVPRWLGALIAYLVLVMGLTAWEYIVYLTPSADASFAGIWLFIAAPQAAVPVAVLMPSLVGGAFLLAFLIVLLLEFAAVVGIGLRFARRGTPREVVPEDGQGRTSSPVDHLPGIALLLGGLSLACVLLFLSPWLCVAAGVVVAALGLLGAVPRRFRTWTLT